MSPRALGFCRLVIDEARRARGESLSWPLELVNVDERRWSPRDALLFSPGEGASLRSGEWTGDFPGDSTVVPGLWVWWDSPRRAPPPRQGIIALASPDSTPSRELVVAVLDVSSEGFGR
eukprot:CAMPEP_0182860302 /NCGR_PEP_ID=MMETSP0034_2-20130328/4838_1 /TAXON_ID=156128 /ORGANISM="Nephroselmis pyriformis, Strain CCMP717" /LENGTH=118 /DNA_ID=CAMNT_0024992081 /DNA_START=104 /DNA_END=457 /DNA_ORIENTATION=-